MLRSGVMGRRDPRVDAYIGQSAAFAKPILSYFRQLVHDTCPDVEETLKWSMPTFMYKGMLCSMGAFKQHCGIGFWKAKLVLGEHVGDSAAGQFGRITKIADLPPKRTLAGYIRKAMALNDQGIAAPRKAVKAAAAPVRVPADLSAALRRNRKAKAAFDAFSPSHRREYIEWITEAKREETRARRVQTAVAWMAEGKTHNWKYER